MIDRSKIYDGKFTPDAEGACYSIINLCKVGLAASDSVVNIDLSKGGYESLLEVIAALAEDAIDRMDAEEKARRRAV